MQCNTTVFNKSYPHETCNVHSVVNAQKIVEKTVRPFCKLQFVFLLNFTALY